jgi:hypothetical protein
MAKGKMSGGGGSKGGRTPVTMSQKLNSGKGLPGISSTLEKAATNTYMGYDSDPIKHGQADPLVGSGGGSSTNTYEKGK